MRLPLLLGLVLVAATSAAPARDLIAPSSESALDQRIAFLQQEAEYAPCDIKDRVCAVGKRTLMQSGLQLAGIYPNCTKAAAGELCEKNKQSRLVAAEAAKNAMVVKSIAAYGGPVIFLGMYGRSEHPDPEKIAEYAKKTEHDLAASTCPDSEKVCAIGELAVIPAKSKLVAVFRKMFTGYMMPRAIHAALQKREK